MQDWDEPLDKGPQIEEPNRRHKKRGGKKPFVIERRYIGPERHWMSWMCDREWHPYRRYKTEKDRDKALASLDHKKKNSYTVLTYWEYRV